MAITINGNGTVSGITAGLTAASMPAGSVVQVKGAFKTDTFTTTSTSFVDIDGTDQDGSGSIWCVKITPASSSNKIVVMLSADGSNTSSDPTSITIGIFRDSTNLLGSAVSNRHRGWQLGQWDDYNTGESMSCQILDSPSTTSEITYKVRMRAQTATGTLNRSGSDVDNADYGYRSGSSLVVMEVVG